VLTTTSITAINVFDEIVALLGYSTANNTLMMEIYMRTFRYMRFGEGSALTYLVMLFAGIFGIAYTRTVYKEVKYL
jgi:multiple sugar transport system permease protein